MDQGQTNLFDLEIKSILLMLYLKNINKLCLPLARCMSSNNCFKRDTFLVLLICGKPLKGERRPFHLMDKQSIVQIAAILHPNFVFFLRSQFRFLIHVARVLINQVIIISKKYTMIRDILNQYYRKGQKQQLYKNKFACGCLYRSFQNMEIFLFFRFTSNNARLNTSAINQLKQMLTQEGYRQLNEAIKKFQQLAIIKYENSEYRINEQFIRNLESFLKQERVLESLDPQKINLDMSEELKQPSAYQLIKYYLTKKDINFNRFSTSSKPQTSTLRLDLDSKSFQELFHFIKSDIAYKIKILLDRMLSANKRNIEVFLTLSLLQSDCIYQTKDSFKQLLRELQKLNLARLYMGQKYFRISKSLEEFTDRKLTEKNSQNRLNISITVQTNFKVFIQIKSKETEEVEFIRQIFRLLLKIPNQNVSIPGLIIGEITEEFMKKFFGRYKISTDQYFNFLQQYTQQSSQTHKDLGKWKKLKFLGLQGPSSESNIPNNIKQQVKIWQYEVGKEDHRK